MKIRPPRRKKYCKLNPKKQIPFPNIEENSILLTGRFNGFGIIVENANEINVIHSNGFFGKGCYSRSFPSYNNQPTPKIIRKRQYKQRKEWTKAFGLNKIRENSVIVCSDSDSESEDFFKNLKPELVQSLPIVENLQLALEEAYFLMTSVKCLKICDMNNQKFDNDSAWKLFCECQENFVQNYIVYYYFRTRNWVVKSGLKFGGDFLLYHKGPPFCHASYLVIIDVLKSDTYERDTSICKRSMNWTNLIGLNRLAETAAKELLICQVIWPKDISVNTIKSACNLKSFCVNPVLMRRWIAKQERATKNLK